MEIMACFTIIFKIHTKSMPLGKDVSMEELAEKTNGFSGADIEGVVREAAMMALRKDIKAKEVRMANFEQALSEARGSITEDVMKYYRRVKDDLSSVSKRELKERDIQYL